MKPSRFEYHVAASVDEAIAFLQSHGPDARLLAGGQSLLPMMNFRLATPSALIDLNRIPRLAAIDDEQPGIVKIGAMTRQRALEFSPIIAEKLPLLREAIRLVGHLPTRTRGTIGGSIAHADPSAEIPMAVLALDGQLRVQGPSGERNIPAVDFFQDAMTTALEPDEVLFEVRLPVLPHGAGWAVEEFSRRHGDFAIAAIAAIVVPAPDGQIEARLACAGVASHPIRLRLAEEALRSGGLTQSNVREAAAMAAIGIEPLADQAASGEFRLHLAKVLTKRALLRAVARANFQGSGDVS
jgi:carbon-monoxide dehydrogenase medium subunit